MLIGSPNGRNVHGLGTKQIHDTGTLMTTRKQHEDGRDGAADMTKGHHKGIGASCDLFSTISNQPPFAFCCCFCLPCSQKRKRPGRGLLAWLSLGLSNLLPTTAGDGPRAPATLLSITHSVNSLPFSLAPLDGIAISPRQSPTGKTSTQFVRTLTSRGF